MSPIRTLFAASLVLVAGGCPCAGNVRYRAAICDLHQGRHGANVYRLPDKRHENEFA